MAYLPQELIDNVVSFVNDNQTLAALARVSRRLNRTTTPLLYRHVSLSSQSDAWSFCDGLKSLTIRLLQDPELGALVETLELRYSPEYLTSLDAENTTTLEEVFKNALQNVRHPYLSQNFAIDQDILRPTQIEFLMALLLLKLPNLRNFYAFPPKVPSEAYWHALGAHGPHSRILQSPFKALDTVVLNGQQWIMPVQKSDIFSVTPPNISTSWVDSMMSHIVPHIQAFNPRKLVVLDMGHCPPRDAGAVWGTRGYTEYIRGRPNRRTQKLDHFEMRGTSLPLDRFLSFIMAPAKLETFIYEHPLNSHFSIGSLVRLLIPQGVTITHLSLDVQSPDQREDPIIGELLNEFTALEQLEIASTYLFSLAQTAESIANTLGHLPINISRLRILKTEGLSISVEEIIHGISSRSADILPNLRMLEIEGYSGAIIIS